MVFMVSCSFVIHGATMIQPPLCPSSGSGLARVTRDVKIFRPTLQGLRTKGSAWIQKTRGAKDSARGLILRIDAKELLQFFMGMAEDDIERLELAIGEVAVPAFGIDGHHAKGIVEIDGMSGGIP